MWQRRQDVSRGIGSQLAQELPAVGASLLGLQLLSLDIANRLQDAIENTTVQQVGIDIAQVQQQADVVSAVTAQLQAQQSLLVTVIDATAAANATVITAQAQASALNATYAAQGAALQRMGSALGLSTDQVLAVSWIDAVQAAHSSSINIAVPQP
jgi:negative regulator of sigma E activity